MNFKGKAGPGKAVVKREAVTKGASKGGKAKWDAIRAARIETPSLNWKAPDAPCRED